MTSVDEQRAAAIAALGLAPEPWPDTPSARTERYAATTDELLERVRQMQARKQPAPPVEEPPAVSFQTTLIEGLAELTFHVERIADVLEAEGAKSSVAPGPATLDLDAGDGVADFDALGAELASGFGEGDGIPDLAAYAARFMRSKFGGGP